MNTKKWGPTGLYLAGCAVLLRWYWYSLNPDTLSYFSIAHHYLRGEWGEVINTNWSPMASWLALPLLALQMSDLAAFRLITIASGVLFLYGVRKLAEDFELTSGWSQGVQYTAAFMTVAFALLRLGPDLLVAALLLLYSRVVIRGDFGRKGSGVTAGLLGAAAYLTKGYALYFFLGHFALVSVMHFFRSKGGERSAIPRQWALGMLTFVVFTAPWFGAMASKTGHLTLGTLGDWNHRLVGPEAPVYPQYFGLIPPTGEHGSSMWEEPSPALLPSWNVLSSSGLKHQAKLTFANVKALTEILLYTSFLSFAAIFAYMVWGLGHSLSARRIPWLGTLLTIGIYPAGYLLIVIVDRYFWMIFVLVLLMGAVVAQDAARGLGKYGKGLLAAGYFLSFLLLPARMLVAQANDATWGPIAEHLRAQAPGVSGTIAGCGGWNDNVQIAWALGMRSYGEVAPTPDELTVREVMNPSARGTPPPHTDTSEETARKLETYKIDYFLALPACDTLPTAAQVNPPVAEWRGARLYRLR